MKETIKRIFSISVSQIIFVITFLLIVLIDGKIIINRDSDMLWHIKSGDYILANKALYGAANDPFSYLKTMQGWENHEWGSDILFSLIYKWFGFFGMVVLTASIVAFIMYIIYRYISKKNILLSIFIMIPTFIAVDTHILPRPHLFSFLFIVVWYIFIDEYYKNNKKLIYLLPIFTIIWVNLHGGILYAFVIFGLFLIGILVEVIIGNKEYLKRGLIIFYIMLTCLVTSGLNPYGYSWFINFIRGFIVAGDGFYNGLVLEFLSASFNKTGFVQITIIALIIITAILYKYKKGSSVYVIFLMFWMYQSLQYRRHFAVLGLFLPFLIIELIELKKVVKFEKIVEKYFSEKAFPIIGGAVCIIVVMMIKFNIINYKLELNKYIFPVRAVNYLKKNPIEGNGVNNYLYGGYLIWEFYPEKKVSIDPRMAPYSKDDIRENFLLEGFPKNYKQILNSRNVMYLIFPNTTAIIKGLKYDKEWECVYIDDTTSIYKRKIVEDVNVEK